MITFEMHASANPAHSAKWFLDFSEGREFQADSLDAAQEWLDAQCEAAGTAGDPNFSDNGPIARSMTMTNKPQITKDDEQLIAEWGNYREVSVDDEGDVWVSDPCVGHWLSSEDKSEYLAWINSQ